MRSCSLHWFGFALCVSISLFNYNCQALIFPAHLRGIKLPYSHKVWISRLDGFNLLEKSVVSNNTEFEFLKDIVAFGNDRYNQYAMNSSDFSGMLVEGCTSTVRIDLLIQDNNTMQWRGFADSLVSKGMLSIMLEVRFFNQTCSSMCKNVIGLQRWNGLTANELLARASDDWMEKANLLRTTISLARLNGFMGILNTMQHLATQSFSHDHDGRVTSNSKKMANKDLGAFRRIDADEENFPVNKLAPIAVLLSGGVDSSVALQILQLRGYSNISAFYIKIWLEDELTHLSECPWEEDLRYATAVCKHLDVPLEIVSLQDDYWKRVVQYTLSEALQGRTPNPDIMCNNLIKFGVFYEKFGHRFDRIATGHYARLLATNHPNNISLSQRRIELRTSGDSIKDQTYFLSLLRQDQLAQALFPIGNLSKVEVISIIHAHKFDNVLRQFAYYVNRSDVWQKNFNCRHAEGRIRREFAFWGS